MQQFSIIVTLFTFATSSVILTDKEWTLFKENYGKTYPNPEEENYRKNIFNENLKKIKLHNEKAIRGEHSYQLGITKFADLTIDEMEMPELEVEPQPLDVKFHHKSYFKAPESVDWRTKGILTEVKNQGKCPSCWAFTGAATIEAAYAQATGQLLNLSVQNILDCAPKSRGCTPGYVSTVYYYAKDKGIYRDDCYPYESHDDLSRKVCRVKSECDRIKISDIIYVRNRDENALRDAVAKHVVTGYIYSELEDFKFYKDAMKKGLRLDESYPYESYDDASGQKPCKFSSGYGRIKIKDFVFIPKGDENALRDAVAEHVVAGYIYASLHDFKFYKGGIYSNPDCRKDKITHLVPIVGYGTENGTPYWIIKNSWGEHWGENGYGRILRGNNTCGITLYSPSYPRI